MRPTAVDGWEIRRLGEPRVALIIMGQSPDSRSYNAKGHGLPFFQGKADFGRTSPSPTKWCSVPTKTAQAGDVLVSVRAPVGDTNVATGVCCIGRGLAALRSGNDIAPGFLHYLLAHERERLRSLSSGAIFESINKDTLDSFEIAVPDTATQRGIVAVLDTLVAALDQQDEIVRTLRELKTTTIEKLFGLGRQMTDDRLVEGAAVPEGWTIARIGDFFKVGNGSTPARTKAEYWADGKIPWLNSGKVHEGTITQADQFVTDLAKRECHLPLVPSGSVVVAITGQGKTLGNVALLGLDTTVNQHLAYMTPNGADVSGDYLAAYLGTRYADLRRSASAGGTTKGALTCSLLERYPLPICSPDQRQTITDTTAAANAAYAAARLKAEHLRHLFAAALHLLITGQLNPSPVSESKP